MGYEAGYESFRKRGLKLAIIAAALFAAAMLTFQIVGGGSGNASASSVDPADLALTKSDSPDPVAPDATLTYTIQVTNNGPDAATNVVITDNLPSDVSFVSATSTTGSCDNTGNKVTCTVASLDNAATVTATIKVTVKKNTKSGPISNTASVTSDIADPTAANDQDTENTQVVKPSGPTCRNKTATIVGTGNDDVLTGTAGDDVIIAFAGNDTIRSGDGKDLVCANRGADFVNAGPRGDFVKGGAGPDLIKGRAGGDELRGNRGNDRLRGNGGPDLLAGGRGFDSCRGGAGNDTLRSCP
jgi:uncharacterized repeat protein (TIGR01451 family)